jgi:hypothetical protein
MAPNLALLTNITLILKDRNTYTQAYFGSLSVMVTKQFKNLTPVFKVLKHFSFATTVGHNKLEQSSLSICNLHVFER